MKRHFVPIFLCLVLSIASYSQSDLTERNSTHVFETENHGKSEYVLVSNERRNELQSNSEIKTSKNDFGSSSISTFSINLVIWNGSVSSDWFNGANWTVLQGRPLLPPGENDMVEIGTQDFYNQPNINDVALIKNLLLGSAKAVTLTLSQGGSLTIKEDINGSWLINQIHRLNINDQTLSVNGNLILSDGTIGNSIDLNLNSGIVSINGSLIQKGNANIIFSGPGVVDIGQDFIYTDGTFTAGEGTLIYNGSGSQLVAGVAYNHLTIKKVSGIASLDSEATITGNLSISAGEFDVNGFLNQNGKSGTALNINEAATLKISGVNSLPTFIYYNLDSLSTVEYAGTNQIISGAMPYGNISISSAGTKAASAPLTIRNNFSLSNGIFVGGNFSHKVGGNWSITSGSFSNAGTRIILNGTSNQNISSTAPFSNLTINKSVGLVTLSSNVTINSNLDLLAGKISVGNNILIINSFGTITGANASKYVIVSGWGNLTQTVFKNSGKLFPVGTSTNYIPATIALTSTSVTDNISVRVLNGMFSNGQNGTPFTANAVNATWIITEGTVGGSNATVTLQWPQSLELIGFNRSFCVDAQYSSGLWKYGMSAITATGPNPFTESRSGITSFSPLGIISFNPLPLTWLSLSGHRVNNNNYINWKTVNGSYTRYFVIESSTNGFDFTEVGRIMNTLNNNSIHSYEFIHDNVLEKRIYYRIKQMDIDQRFSYSSIITIESGNFLNDAVLLTPNPILNKGTVYIQSKMEKEVDLIIIDLEGRLIYKQQLSIQRGINSFNIDFSNQSSGLYILKIEGKNKVKQVVKFIKK